MTNQRQKQETGLAKGDFLEKGYQLPDKSKQFLKIDQGDNVIRFLSNPLTGWVFFNEDKKPVRRAYDSTIPTLGDFSKDELSEMKAKKGDNGEFEGSRHFWIALVWDRATASPKVLEVTQITVIKPLFAYFNDADWGDLRDYDININKQGSGQYSTEYTVSPKPKKALTKNVIACIEELEANGLLDLSAIWKGEYPFEKYLY